MDYLSTSYVPPIEIRHTRDLLRHRIALVKQRTQVKKTGLPPATEERRQDKQARMIRIFCKSGLTHLHRVELPEMGKPTFLTDLHLLDYLNCVLDQSDGELAKMVWKDPRTRLFMTTPGVNYTVLPLLIEIGNTKILKSEEAALLH